MELVMDIIRLTQTNIQSAKKAGIRDFVDRVGIEDPW